jgi:hypothetical protein
VSPQWRGLPKLNEARRAGLAASIHNKQKPSEATLEMVDGRVYSIVQKPEIVGDPCCVRRATVAARGEGMNTLLGNDFMRGHGDG